MSTRWGLIVEETEGIGERRTWSARELARVEGTWEEALARLQKLAWNYAAQHPASPVSTQLYRTYDGFLMLNEGSMRTYQCRFSVAELLYDTADQQRAAAAAREAEKAAAAAQKAAEKAARKAQRGGWFGGR